MKPRVLANGTLSHLLLLLLTHVGLAGATSAQSPAPGQQFTAAPPTNGFGWQVAGDGEVVAVASAAGVWVFEFGDSGWEQAAFLDSFLGGQLATLRLAFDGGQIAVGFPGDGSGGLAGSGRVVVIEEVSGVWQATQELFSPDPGAFDNFGNSVAIRDGWLLVAETGDDEAGTDAGAVFAYSLPAVNAPQKLMGSQGGSTACFGESVSVSGDSLVVGTEGEGAYVFQLGPLGWEETVYFPPPSPPTSFGCWVGIDGGTVMVSDLRYASWSGRVHVFAEDGAGQWSESTIEPVAPLPDGNFGAPISMRNGRALIGEVGRDVAGPFTGRAYLYDQSASGWAVSATLQQPNPAAGDGFGGAHSLDLAGNAFIGSVGDDSAGPNAGAVFWYFLGSGFRRGDANFDGAHNIADPIAVLGALFGGQPLVCDDAGDANDDGSLNIADAIAILQVLFFSSSPPLPDPFLYCAEDPTTDPLDCAGPIEFQCSL